MRRLSYAVHERAGRHGGYSSRGRSRYRLPRCGLTAPHLAWKESASAFVCYAIPAASVGREGRPVSGTWGPLVPAAIWVSTAVAIRRGHVVGVCVMGMLVRHGA
jgi:hypothetical protein